MGLFWVDLGVVYYTDFNILRQWATGLFCPILSFAYLPPRRVILIISRIESRH